MQGHEARVSPADRPGRHGVRHEFLIREKSAAQTPLDGVRDTEPGRPQQTLIG
ncbi:hypothetical protein ACVHNB_22335 [Streptomyces sp. YJ-C3]